MSKTESFEYLDIVNTLRRLINGAYPASLFVDKTNSNSFFVPPRFDDIQKSHIAMLDTDRAKDLGSFNARAETYETFTGLIKTRWSGNYFPPDYSCEIPERIKYSQTNLADTDQPLREANIILCGFFVETSFFHNPMHTEKPMNSFILATVPYKWSSDDARGKGEIALILQLEPSPIIQISFRKAHDGVPLFTGTYTINISTALSRVESDKPIFKANQVDYNEGPAAKPFFERNVEFFKALLEQVSTYASNIMHLTFATLLCNYEMMSEDGENSIDSTSL